MNWQKKNGYEVIQFGEFLICVWDIEGDFEVSIRLGFLRYMDIGTAATMEEAKSLARQWMADYIIKLQQVMEGS